MHCLLQVQSNKCKLLVKPEIKLSDVYHIMVAKCYKILRLNPYLKTNITSRMLMIPKQAANSAGAVYILTWSWMNFTLMPVSPMNDKAACRTEKLTQSTSFKVNGALLNNSRHKVGNNYWFSLQMHSATNMLLLPSHKPGPSMKPRAWLMLMLAIALVLSFRDVAPATYDLTTATLPTGQDKGP